MKKPTSFRDLLLAHDIPIRRNGLLQLGLCTYAGFWLWMSVHPYSSYDWWLENLLTFLALAGLMSAFPFFRFNNLSSLLILAFLALHTLGAHYSYNTTPIDSWINRLFHFGRDNYDRVVHFSFGLLVVYPVREFVVRVILPRQGWSYILAPLVILAFGAFYELIEMWVAQIVAPEIGTLFLGTQGDPWDSQHDMEAALYGAAAVMAVNAAVNFAFGRKASVRRKALRRSAGAGRADC